jgi:uncharacterized iron-regulated membrane protein
MGRTVIGSLLRRLHRWVGLALALPLIVQALTGLIMMADPFVASIRGVPSGNGLLTEPDDLRNLDAMAILATARAAVAADLVPTRWRVEPDAIIAVDFAQPGHQQAVAQVAVDTMFTTVISVRRDPDSFYRWVHSVHETLLMGPTGRGIVGWIGVALLLMALLGIPLWWPPGRRWKTGFTISHGAGGWRLQRELHGAAGIWLVALLLLQSVSGIALAFPQTARMIAGLPVPASRGQGTQGGGASSGAPVDPVRSIADGVAAAQAAVPWGLLRDLRRPAVPGRPMIAVLLPPGRWEGSPGAVVSMDPVTARVLSVQDPKTATVGVGVLNWLRALHEGGAAGPLGRAVMCLFAVALPLFPVTGIAMWTLRWRSRKRAGAAAGDVVVGP